MGGDSVQQIRKRLSYANVMSTIAMFLALGGATALAVQQLPKRSVGAKQLRPGAVTKGKLRRSSVTAPKIKALAVKTGKLANGAVKTAKLGNRAVTSGKLRDGAVTGEKVAAGAVTGDKVVESTLAQVPSANQASFAAVAESANPVVFARVLAGGGVDTSGSKGIGDADVTRVEAGVYCIMVPGFSPRGGQVTPHSEGSKETIAHIKVAGGAPSCAVPGVEVRTWKEGVATDAGFYLVLYR
jgi:hypothetical protein